MLLSSPVQISLFRLTNEIFAASIKRRRLKCNEVVKPTKPSMMGGVHRFRQRPEVTSQGASLYQRMSEFATRIQLTAGFFDYIKIPGQATRHAHHTTIFHHRKDWN
jgi:hypothetical protein